jgi:hypothetical protein
VPVVVLDFGAYFSNLENKKRKMEYNSQAFRCFRPNNLANDNMTTFDDFRRLCPPTLNALPLLPPSAPLPLRLLDFRLLLAHPESHRSSCKTRSGVGRWNHYFVLHDKSALLVSVDREMFTTAATRVLTPRQSLRLFKQSLAPTLSKRGSIRFLSSEVPGGPDDLSSGLYLHVGPSGDCWTGHSIFAAKHLQPDYVKSVKLEPGICVDTLIDLLEENDAWAQQIYDEESFPMELLDALKTNGIDEGKNERG